MNVIQIVADMTHLLAIMFLIIKIWKTKSCTGISGKSQILFALVCVTRYLDLFCYFVSYYNSILKVVFIVTSWLTVCLIYIKFRTTFNYSDDSFRVEILLIPVGGLALFVNHEFSVLEVLWTFSIYLEAVAIVPQLFMMMKTGKAETINLYYLFAFGLYRALYIVNWIYRYKHEGYWDLIAFTAGCVQTILFCQFFWLYHKKRYGHNYKLENYLHDLSLRELTSVSKWQDPVVLTKSFFPQDNVPLLPEAENEESQIELPEKVIIHSYV
ncbi:ER lumen protein-retaining receptor 2 isoform X1 [Biomphalaria pfeifferi]|uniref:ER lumen protein-retaining receptor 2 isoform X1 n=1 Tax=Biomphalaria pfeifferi TaxID=112525 RepID=A0AAD8B1E3_BIOPF|nr:ER lumen protein-retaining receptor 2 isoform X1 [Biomphalaria pfeifferi]